MKIKIKNKKKVRIHIDRLKDSASKNTEDDRVPWWGLWSSKVYHVPVNLDKKITQDKQMESINMPIKKKNIVKM